MSPATESGSAAACNAATRPPIELPTRMAGDGTDRVRGSRSAAAGGPRCPGPAPGRGESVPDQVEGQHPRVPAQGGADGRPVEVGPAEAVDADQQRPVGGPAHVQVVDRSVDVDGAVTRRRLPGWGHPHKATGRRRPVGVGRASEAARRGRDPVGQAGRKSSSSRLTSSGASSCIQWPGPSIRS